MKFLSILFCFALIGCTNTTTQNPKSILSQHKVMATVWFQQSAEMEAIFIQAYNRGKYLLKSKLDTLPEGGSYGVVLDLDETVLDNSPYEALMIETGDTYSSETWQEWTSQARASALPGALDFVNFVEANGVEVFYISNRRVVELEATIKNLNDLSFPNADSDHILLRSESGDKTERRQTVADQVEILLFVGDNLTDYSEEFADRGSDLGKNLVHSSKNEWLNNFIVLPNPGYGEWEKAIYGNDFSISDDEKVERRLGVLKK